MKDTLYWSGGRLYLLDQRLLPHRIKYVCCRNTADTARAIETMVVRGAPAIGVTAGFGMVLAAGEKKTLSIPALGRHLASAGRKLAATRPTAVNLFWAIKRMNDRFAEYAAGSMPVSSMRKALETEAKRMYREDVECNRRMGANGARLLGRGSTVITHCNAGALATAGYGTALGVIRAARAKGKIKLVYADETRPYLQGARLTAWELKEDGIPCRILCDGMAGHIMKTEKVSAVITGADRIAANGDSANKIGTYSLAVLAKYHRIPFYIAAPWSTIDTDTRTGGEIPIEERNSREVTCFAGREIAPAGVKARHPAFDVTPAKLITAIITEKGVCRYPYRFRRK